MIGKLTKKNDPSQDPVQMAYEDLRQRESYGYAAYDGGPQWLLWADYPNGKSWPKLLALLERVKSEMGGAEYALLLDAMAIAPQMLHQCE